MHYLILQLRYFLNLLVLLQLQLQQLHSEVLVVAASADIPVLPVALASPTALRRKLLHDRVEFFLFAASLRLQNFEDRARNLMLIEVDLVISRFSPQFLESMLLLWFDLLADLGFFLFFYGFSLLVELNKLQLQIIKHL